MQHGFDYPSLVCDGYEDQLNEYADGELSFDGQSDLFGHLAECEQCRRYLESVIALRRIVAEDQIRLPPSFDEDFLQRLAHHRESVGPSKDRQDRQSYFRTVIPRAGRLAVLTLVLGIVIGHIFTILPSEPESAQRIVAEEELVNFPTFRNADLQFAPVYVFYPGLTVEAENWEEPLATDAL